MCNYRSAVAQAAGTGYYVEGDQPIERPGKSYFLRDEDRVFHTYSMYGRGDETVGGSYYYLDHTALGRQEEWEEPKGRAPSARSSTGLRIMIDVNARPSVAQVEEVYLAAAAQPPLNEGLDTARLFAGLYGELQSRDDLLVVTATVDDELAGIAYGNPWHWSENSDNQWAQLLRERLGEEAADLIEGALSIHLLAVRPCRQRHGLGRRLFQRLMDLGGPRAWLQTTDVDSPARRLYESLGWTAIGEGPNAPDGRPGLVMASRHRRERDWRFH